MSDKCNGLLGKIFGHNYKSFPLEKTCSESIENYNNFIEVHKGMYIIVCKRCGKHLDKY